MGEPGLRSNLETFAEKIGVAASLISTYREQELSAGSVMIGALAAGAGNEAAQKVAVQVHTDPDLLTLVTERGGRYVGAWQFLQNVSAWFGNDAAIALAEARIEDLSHD